MEHLSFSGLILDTVPNAGRYDGSLARRRPALAVAAAARGAARTVCSRSSCSPRRKAAFRDRVPRLGRVHGRVRAGPGPRPRRRRGRHAGEGDPRRGWGPDAAVGTPAPELAGYVEVHIEQGPVLEREGLPVGVVTAIAGQTRARITITGEAGHAGRCPWTRAGTRSPPPPRWCSRSSGSAATWRAWSRPSARCRFAGRRERRPGRGARCSSTSVMPMICPPAGGGRDPGRGRADRRGARRRRRLDAGTTPLQSSSTRTSASASATRSSSRACPFASSSAARSRRRRPLSHLPRCDALRPLRRRGQPRPARVGVGGGRRGRARRPRARRFGAVRRMG